MDTSIIRTKNFTGSYQKWNSKPLNLGSLTGNDTALPKEFIKSWRTALPNSWRHTFFSCGVLIEPRYDIIENLEYCLVRFTFQDSVICTFVEAQLLVLALSFLIQSLTNRWVSNQISLTVQDDQGQRNLCNMKQDPTIKVMTAAEYKNRPSTNLYFYT